MGVDALEQLRRENPVPEPMAMLPIEPVLRRLDRELPVVAERSVPGRRRLGASSGRCQWRSP